VIVVVVCVQILLFSWLHPLLLGHDLQVLEGILGGMPLGIGSCWSAAVANANGQRGQLNQALELAREGLLLYVHIGHLELVLRGDFAQQLDVINLVVLQASLLKKIQMESN